METQTEQQNSVDESDTSLLVVIIDCNIYSWGNRFKQLLATQDNRNSMDVDSSGSSGPTSTSLISFNSFIDHLMIFINAYLMLNQENQVSVISSKIGDSQYIYPEYPPQKQFENKSTQSIIRTKLSQLDLTPKQQQSSNEDSLSSNFSAALSLSLCYINRIKKEIPNIRPRIFVVNISPDVSSQYIPVMNCIFSAQKQSIPLDSCILSQHDSTLLQQASHLTNGIYLKPKKQAMLSQYLLTTFLIDTTSRKTLLYPTLKSVDFRASCFCHKTIVDVGFVCSVCLSIFCTHSSSCSTCGTKFSLKIELPKKKSSSSVPSSQESNNKEKDTIIIS